MPHQGQVLRMSRDRRRLNREDAAAWQRIGRDIGNSLVGWGMLIWQTVYAVEPNYLLVGAGLLLVGLAPALRVDEMIRRRGDSEPGGG